MRDAAADAKPPPVPACGEESPLPAARRPSSPQGLADDPAGVCRRGVCGAPDVSLLSAPLPPARENTRVSSLRIDAYRRRRRAQGGADILMSMHQSGELEKLLKAKPK